MYRHSNKSKEARTYRPEGDGFIIIERTPGNKNVDARSVAQLLMKAREFVKKSKWKAARLRDKDIAYQCDMTKDQYDEAAAKYKESHRESKPVGGLFA